MKEYTKNEQANFQINAIRSMLGRGFSDIEIAANFNNIGERNLEKGSADWAAKDIRLIVTNFNLDDSILVSSSAAATLAPSSVFKFFCVLGGTIAIFGGLSLASLNAAGENSIPEAIANGVGWYCIGKGIFMIASTFQIKSAK